MRKFVVQQKGVPGKDQADTYHHLQTPQHLIVFGALLRSMIACSVTESVEILSIAPPVDPLQRPQPALLMLPTSVQHRSKAATAPWSELLGVDVAAVNVEIGPS